MSRAIDCVTDLTPHAHVLPGALIHTVMRYVGHPGNAYNLTAPEVKALHAHGIGIGFVYEAEASWMKGGYMAGIRAASAARDHLRVLGAPKHPFVYFAADWDVLPGEVDVVLKCLLGAGSVIGTNRVGIYGGHRIVTRALAAGAAARAWQALGWSYGKRNSAAVLHQTSIAPAQPWGDLGFPYDADSQRAQNIGQWSKP